MSDNIWGNKETSFFYELTPDKILDAVEAIGIRTTGRTLQLNSMENRVYQVELEVEDEDVQSVYEKYRVVKFYRPGRWSREQILEEHRFLTDLVEADVPVVAPIHLGAEVGSTLGKVAGAEIWFAVFPRVGGRTPQEMTMDQIEIMGRLMARLHNVGAAKGADHRFSINPEVFGERNLKTLQELKLIPIDLESRYRSAVEEICTITTPWFQQVEKIRIHGDCHLGNLIWGSEGPFWVDFDDMLVGPAVQDMWLMIPGREQEDRIMREIFLEAYESMRNFDRSSLRLVEPLRALRFIHFSAWISKRWEDPAFKRVFQDFNSWQYWNEQVALLEEQLQFIRKLN